jgi:hypothetical protein
MTTNERRALPLYGSNGQPFLWLSASRLRTLEGDAERGGFCPRRYWLDKVGKCPQDPADGAYLLHGKRLDAVVNAYASTETGDPLAVLQTLPELKPELLEGKDIQLYSDQLQALVDAGFYGRGSQQTQVEFKRVETPDWGLRGALDGVPKKWPRDGLPFVWDLKTYGSKHFSLDENTLGKDHQALCYAEEMMRQHGAQARQEGIMCHWWYVSKERSYKGRRRAKAYRVSALITGEMVADWFSDRVCPLAARARRLHQIRDQRGVATNPLVCQGTGLPPQDGSRYTDAGTCWHKLACKDKYMSMNIRWEV